ncbi:hypothetical protein [Niveibacterium terrae]|uniref:hypothetical protein n=1 Tax=Niveibacterium terrae TaxID=3373598 RepID=UPI003A94A20D
MSDPETQTAATTTEGQTQTEAQAAAAAPETAAQQAEQSLLTSAETKAAAPAEQTQQAAPRAPEKYEFKLPDGNAALSGETLTAFEDVARELDLPQDQAQKVIDKLAPAIAAQNAAAFDQAKTDWASASSSDKEFGGDKLTENLAVAKKAVDQFASPDLRKLLESSGFGNHPEVVRLFYRVGQRISEDKFVSGGTRGATRNSAAAVLYDNTQS